MRLKSNSAYLCYKIADRKQRGAAFALLTVIVFTAVLEVGGIGTVMIFMKSLVSPESVGDISLLDAVVRGLGLPESTDIRFVLGGIVVATLFLRNLVAAAHVWIRLWVTYMFSHSMSLRLLNKYSAFGYDAFLKQNTSTMQAAVLNEAPKFVNAYIVSYLSIIADTILVCAILGLLVWRDPFVALAAFGISGGLYICLYMTIYKRLAAIGRRRLSADADRYKGAAQFLSGIKEIKVSLANNYFIKKFDAASYISANLNIEQKLYSQVPKHFFDFLIFGGLVLTSLALLERNQGFEEVIATLTLFGMAGYRLIPALDRLLNGFSSLKATQASYDMLVDVLLAEDVDAPPTGPRETIKFDDRIVLENVGFKYDETAAAGISEISFEIPFASSVALVGKSGAGKSTLINVILGLLPCQTGKLTVDGVAVTKSNLSALRGIVGYVPQQIYLIDDTIERNIAFGVEDSEIDSEKVRRAAQLAELQEFIESDLPNGFETVIGENGTRLSGGQRQRLGIARALYKEPRLLVLDEATSALDLETEKAIAKTIAALQKSMALVIVAHRPQTIHMCENVIVMSGGEKIDAGRYDEVARRHAGLRDHNPIVENAEAV